MSSLAVVVGVVVSRTGAILLAQRAGHQHLAGLWEFPGGKLEPSEPPLAGLWRELKEELGIDLISAEPLIQIHHQYPDKSVLLDVYLVREYTGVPTGREGQPLAWVDIANLDQFPLPEANLPIVKALRLPREITISGAARTPEEWLQKFALRVKSGDRYLLIRPFEALQKSWNWMPIFLQACELAKIHAAHIILHSSLVTNLAKEIEIFSFLKSLPSVCIGVHLSSAVANCWVDKIPPRFLVGASCHAIEDLMQLADSVDCAFLSPVLNTTSHPDANPMGWSEFASACQVAKLPVYALGGIQPVHLDLVKNLGGQGVTGIRGFWP